MGGYALDMTSPVRHVATELDRVAPAALSLGDLADTYHHPNPADLVRVRQHEGCDTDRDAVLWLMNRALEKIERRGRTGAMQIVAENGGFRLADGMTFDQLRFNGEGLHRERDDHAQFRDPFNPMSGRFSENIRQGPDRDSLDELKDSMRTFGWVPEFPALRDKRTKVVLVGHRRLKAAGELRSEGVEIEDQYRDLDIGDGDEADARRLSIAIASNLGGKPLTKENRKRIAEHLYGVDEWVMERIAKALQVSVATVHSDLEGFSPPEKPRRPKGGRPKGSTRRTITPEQEQKIEDLVSEGVTARRAVAEELGIGETAAYTAIRAAQAKLADREQQEADTVPAATETTEPAEATCTCPTCGHVHQHP